MSQPESETPEPSVEPAALEPVEPAETVAETVAEEADQSQADARRTERKESRGRPRLALEQLVVGAQTRGKVVGTSKFGAFVDVGAVTDGLVHISELSAKRVRTVEEVVKSGDAVDVWIKEVDLTNGRLSLSMRVRPKNPIDSLKVGDALEGVVTSVTKYGAFVDIGSDTEGLVHVSEMSRGFVGDPKDVAKAGQTVEVRVKEVDLARKRISLSMAAAQSESRPQGRKSREPEPEPMSAEPEEKQPTVVELALRKALGQSDEAADAQPADAAAVKDSAELGDIYARMLADYRASQKTQD